MTTVIPFVKAQGLGNDFIIIESCRLSSPSVKQCQWLSDRHLGIGCDQIIIYEPQNDGHFQVRFYNADGSEAESCGNGSRALANLLLADFPNNAEVVLHTKGGLVPARKIDADFVEIAMVSPVFGDGKIEDLPKVPGMLFPYSVVNLGNPHLVCFVQDLSAVDVSKYGPLLETHSLFPQKTNVSFSQIKSESVIDLRVWERGSGLTLACGTAACATAVAALRQGLCQGMVTVNQPGGQVTVSWDLQGRIFQQGPAKNVFEGTVDLRSI